MASAATLRSTDVISQHNVWVNYRKRDQDDARFTRLLLDHGADPEQSGILTGTP
jgi:hypothetical protein